MKNFSAILHILEEMYKFFSRMNSNFQNELFYFKIEHCKYVDYSKPVDNFFIYY